jgi:hypothetical protein
VWITLTRCLSGLVFAEQAYTILDDGSVLVIGLTDKALDIKLQIDYSSYIKVYFIIHFISVLFYSVFLKKKCLSVLLWYHLVL